MLKIINELSIFLEDCYKEFGVREYSRIMKVTPPTASKILKNLESEGLLKKRKERVNLLFSVNRESSILKDLSRIYWKLKLSSLIQEINIKFHNPLLILFGSLSKLENKKDSDIDLAIITPFNKKIDFSSFEKKFKREIQIFTFKDMSDANKKLKNNILNGYVIQGELN